MRTSRTEQRDTPEATTKNVRPTASRGALQPRPVATRDPYLLPIFPRLKVGAPDSSAERAAEAFAGGCACGGSSPCSSCAPLPESEGPLRSPPSALTPGQGAPLPAELRASLEARASRDLAAVQVHTGDGAAEAAASLGARAYTLGTHIVFGRGAYAPDTSAGRRLIVHEVGHVLQGGRELRRQLDAGVPEIDPVAGVANPNPSPPPPPAYDPYPCNISLERMTNDALRQHLSRTLEVVARGSGTARFGDNLHALRRLTPLRRQRVLRGEMWLADDVHHRPEFLFRIRPAALAEIVDEPLADAFGMPRDLAGATVLTEAQLRAYLRGLRIEDHRIASTIRAVRDRGRVAEVDVATGMRLNRLENERRLAGIRRALGLGRGLPFAPLRGPEGFTPLHSSGAGPLTTIAPGGLRGPVSAGSTSRSISGTMTDLLGANQGRWLRYFGAIGEGSARARFPGYFDLDSLSAARNTGTWDAVVQQERSLLLQVKTQPTSGTAPSRLGRALELLLMRPRGNNTERSQQEARLPRLSEAAGEDMTRQRAIERWMFAVNEDNVAATRAALRDLLRPQRGLNPELVEAVVAEGNVTHDGTPDSPSYTLQDLHSDLAVDADGLSIPDPVLEQTADIASQRVTSHGLTTEQVMRVWSVFNGHMDNVRATQPNLPEGDVVRTAARRITPAEIEVAIDPEGAARRGAGMAIASAAAASLITSGFRLMFSDDSSFASEARVGAVGLGSAATFGGLDALARGGLPSSPVGRLFGGRSMGPAIGVGGAVVAAPVTTMLIMATDPEHEFAARDYTAAMGRTVIPAMVSAGIVEAALAGTATGATVGAAGGPVGSAGGALIGMGLALVTYALTDALIGDEVEAAIRRWIGEPGGCGEPAPDDTGE